MSKRNVVDRAIEKLNAQIDALTTARDHIEAARDDEPAIGVPTGKKRGRKPKVKEEAAE